MYIYRDTALGVKADVDGLLSGFGSGEDSLFQLEDELQNSTDFLNSLKDQLKTVGRRED